MPNLPLASTPAIPAAGDVPVSSSADVLAALPPEIAAPLVAPVRDVLVNAMTAIQLRHQELAGYAAAQADPTRATDTYLGGLADDRGAYQQPNEGNEPLRARVLASPDMVTPTVILAAVNAVLAPVTTVQAQYFESVCDRLFITDGTIPNVHSFIGAGPQYQDRLYPDDTAINGGVVRPQSSPGKAWTFSDTVGRFLVVRIPDLGSIDSNINLVYTGTLLSGTDTAVPELGGATPSSFTGTLLPGQVSPTQGGQGLYIADGSNTSGAEADGSVATFLFWNTTDALSTYQACANAIERVRGHSIRVMLVVDNTLP